MQQSAQSPFIQPRSYDIVPASERDFATMWIERRRGKGGFGATPRPEQIVTPTFHTATTGTDRTARFTLHPQTRCRWKNGKYNGHGCGWRLRILHSEERYGWFETSIEARAPGKASNPLVAPSTSRWTRVARSSTSSRQVEDACYRWAHDY